MPRLKRLPRRLKGPAGVVAGARAASSSSGSGALHLPQHQRLEPVPHAPRRRAVLADYEKALLQFQDLAQPTVTDVQLNVDLYPHAPKLVTHGHLHHRVNRHRRAARASVHVRLDRDTEGAAPERTRARTQINAFDRFNYRIFAFDTPLQPGERATHHLPHRLRRSAASRTPRPHRRRRQRHLRQQLRVRARASAWTAGPAAGPRQAPQVRPAARAAPAEAGGPRRAGPQLSRATTATG